MTARVAAGERSRLAGLPPPRAAASGARGGNRAYFTCGPSSSSSTTRLVAPYERMSALIPTSLVVAALLVLAYIVGTELCLPT
ncbi:MAG TPA: hypothetical protein VET88_01720, partial [Gammaproteobacteria bacterium]|nr:hypothetical protein [Gammaproteobacteria bacterium]